MKHFAVLAAALSLAACATQPPPPSDAEIWHALTGLDKPPQITVIPRAQFDAMFPRNAGGCGMTVLPNLLILPLELMPEQVKIYMPMDQAGFIGCRAAEFYHIAARLQHEPDNRCTEYRVAAEWADRAGEWGLARMARARMEGCPAKVLAEIWRDGE